MKRSDGVTAAAVLMLFGSGFIVLLAAFVAISILGSETTAHSTLFALIPIYTVPAAWGIVNAVGILGLRPWARVSTVVMSIAAGCFLSFLTLGFALAPLLTRGDPEFSNMPSNLIFTIMIPLPMIPLGISIWWIVLFTRKPVVLEFASRSGETKRFGAAK